MRRGLGFLVALLVWSTASAHTTSTGLARYTLDGGDIRERLILPTGDLAPDAGRGLIAAAEGNAEAAETIAEAFRALVAAEADGAPCRMGRIAFAGSRLGEGRVEVEIAYRCAGAPRRLVLRDRLVEVFGEHYRTLAIVEGPVGGREFVFDVDQREVELDLGAPAVSGWLGFLRLGVEHIIGGIDHLLFLLALAVGSGRLLAQIGVVTAFTIAHSITLSLAVLGLAHIPEAVIEPAIAASIAWMGLENLFGAGGRARRWIVTFVFGLVHGFGFASGLLDLEIPRSSLITALVGFNLGVEAGQAMAVLVILPLLAWVRGNSWGKNTLDRLSMALVMVGVLWFATRVFGVFMQ
ncbi:MAG: HupE/UreJ family protein [Alphaproteobacteria bacterium]|nr:HupE/UreJ family protein [Alphaproteobacteria bacterium]